MKPSARIAVFLLAATSIASLLAEMYPATFGIRVTETFVIVTLSAHLIFGATLGRVGVWLGKGSQK